MPEPEHRIDREAAEAIKKIESQMRLEGKLDKADAMEGAAYLLAPLTLGAVFVVGKLLQSAGADGPGLVFGGVAILIGLGLLGSYLMHPK